jgi:hypothetical protein
VPAEETETSVAFHSGRLAICISPNEKLGSGVAVRRTFRIRPAALSVILPGICCLFAAAQSTSAKPEPALVQQAQTVRIPIAAFDRKTLLPIENLAAADLRVEVDGQPVAFQLASSQSRNSAQPRNTAAAQSQPRTNVLILLPLFGPFNRKDVLKDAIEDLSHEANLDWNISILDDSGMQTPYTTDREAVIGELNQIADEKPGDIDLPDWRLAAAVSIANLRYRAGRRIVLSLGDPFHAKAYSWGELVMDNFGIAGLADAAQRAGAEIYAANSAGEVDDLRRLPAPYSLIGSGPWLLLGHDGGPAGWICGSVADTIKVIHRNAAARSTIELHLDPNQMDGGPHRLSISSPHKEIVFDAPPEYVAPSLARLRALAGVSPALREALTGPSVSASSNSDLELATQLAYFPHPDGKTGTQIATTGFFWTGEDPHPAKLDTALQLEQPISGLILDTTIGQLNWSHALPTWITTLDVVPGSYRLRVAAAEPDGRMVAASETPFIVISQENAPVRISSLVLGKRCIFSPQSPEPAGAHQPVDYLEAGNCRLQPDASHYYSPQDILWTLVRITPTGKYAGRKAKDWKASFEIVDEKDHKIADQDVEWIEADDGSLVATAAFPLDNPKWKLEDGDYAVRFRLKGPGIERDTSEEEPFIVYGAEAPEPK